MSTNQTGEVNMSTVDNEETEDTEETDVVEDDDDETPESLPESYDITSFGADWDVDGVVKRMRKGTVFVPPFQRDYVWNIKEASRFIESLLLGLPVPGIFLAKEPETNKLLLIDGQQRCKSLQFFYDEKFNPRAGASRDRVFRLKGVAKRFEGKTYSELEEADQLMLDDSVIHATIVKQESPADDDTSIFRIFERLNSGGRKLVPQEIRVAVYHGELIQFLNELNDDEDWRRIYGKKSARLKDQELVLRYLALKESYKDYKRPMKVFLNEYAQRRRKLPEETREGWEDTWGQTTQLVWNALGKDAFRPVRALNAALYDAVMVGIATALEDGVELDEDAIRSGYEQLLEDKEFVEMFSRSTADDGFVKGRIQKAIDVFGAGEDDEEP